MTVSLSQNPSTRFGLNVTSALRLTDDKDRTEFTVRLEAGEPEQLGLNIPAGKDIYVWANGLNSRDPYQRRLTMNVDGMTSDGGRSTNLVYDYVDSNEALESLHRLVRKLPDAQFASLKRPLAATIDAIGSIFIARGGF